MADSQSLYYNNGEQSPITGLAQDHLYSILFLLPVDSILSFAMTCKRFKSMVYSDSLWEVVCIRDWGPSYVDGLKLSARLRGLSWLNLYQQVLKLDCVACRRLMGPVDDELVPNTRASHSLNLVSNCLVLFGGGSEGGRHLDDTWVACLSNDMRSMLKWQKTSSGNPTGRFGHTCVVVGDSLILFGGINDCGVRQNDAWVGQIAHSEPFGITLSWKPLDIGPVAPPPRGAHAACCIDSKRMLIYGGIGLDGIRVGDTWILELSENFLSGTWHEILSLPFPPARSGHTLTCIDDTRIILFGGRGIGYEVLNDVWVLYMSRSHLAWKQIPYDLRDIPEGVSLPRVGHSATVTLGGRVLIYGGEDSQRCKKSDFWLLDISSFSTLKMHSSSTSPVTLLARMWRKLKSVGYKSNPRSFHAACTDPPGRYLYVFGGMVDGLVQLAEPSSLRFDGELFLVEVVLQL